MNATLLGRFTPGSDEWDAARRSRLGGSEIAAVLGLSPYESRFSLWHRKASLIGPQAGKPEMEWGRRLESAIAEKFCENHPEMTAEHLEQGTYANRDRPWQVASPDLYMHDRNSSVNVMEWAKTFLEVKTAQDATEWGEPGTDEIPVYYRTQVLWYLDALGLDLAHVAVLIRGCDYREYLIKLDDQAHADIQVLRTAAQEFIDSLTAGIRPNIDEHDQTYQAIRETHPDIEAGEEVELEPALAADYLATKDELTAAEKAHKVVRSTVLDALGQANYGLYLGERIVRRQAKEGGLPSLYSTRKNPRGKAATIQGRAA